MAPSRSIRTGLAAIPKVTGAAATMEPFQRTSTEEASAVVASRKLTVSPLVETMPDAPVTTDVLVTAP